MITYNATDKVLPEGAMRYKNGVPVQRELQMRMLQLHVGKVRMI